MPQGIPGTLSSSERNRRLAGGAVTPFRGLKLLTVALAVAVPIGAQAARPFPSAFARLYLRAATTPVPSLLKAAPAPSASAVLAAQRRLRQLASSSGSQRQRALAAMALGVGESRRGDNAAAARDLAQAAAWPPIRDAATAALVAALAAAQDNAGVVAAADKYPLSKDSPFFAQIAWPATQAAAAIGQWSVAVRWSQGLPPRAPVLWLQAQAAAATGQAEPAARLHRELVYRFSASPEARLAQPLWQAELAGQPQLAPTWQMVAQQAAAWTAAGNSHRAALSWQAAADLAPAAQRPRLEAAEARAQLAAGDTDASATLVDSLLTGSERAQALELQVELARRRGDNGLTAPLATLAQEFPTSNWYARALHEAADQALIEADTTTVAERFGRLHHAFPTSAYAPGAAWQAAWAAYRLNQPSTPQQLEQLLSAYPRSSEAVDALYWRGEWARTHGQPRLAQTCFRAAAQRFPGTYFGLQAEKRVSSKIRPAAPPAWLRAFRASQPTPRAAAVTAALRPDLQRAEWLRQAGLDVAAAAILRHAQTQLPAGPASLAVARQLAAMDIARDAWHEGMQAMLRSVPHYLELHPWQLSRRDWTLLFPDAYGGEVSAVARHFALDRNLMLGLVRQESSFDPGSVSAAHARGLAQLELPTARGLLVRLPTAWRRLAGPGALSPQDLLNPSLSLALGAAEMHRLLAEFHDPVVALAAYNAGESRARQWQQAYPGLGSDAFIESIPFGQTRAYVQGVLRNAAHYRRLYGH